MARRVSPGDLKLVRLNSYHIKPIVLEAAVVGFLAPRTIPKITLKHIKDTIENRMENSHTIS